MKLDHFSAEVLVGGKPLKEHRRGDRPKACECTVAYSLHEACSYPMKFDEQDPYGEAYTQEWPVTPYTLRVSNNLTTNVWVETSIDGSPAGTHFLCAGQSTDIEGFRVYNEAGARGHRPLLFSMPRQMRSNEYSGAAREVSEVATIKLRFKEATFSKTVSTAALRPNLGRRAGAAHDAVNKSAARLAKSESVSRAGAEVFANPTRGELEGRKQINIWNFGPRIAELTFRYGTIANLKARGVDIGDIYELPKPAWWRQAFSYVGSFFSRAPVPGDKRKREDGGGRPSKKPVLSVEDNDDDVVDLTV